MHVVVETPPYLVSADEAGLREAERDQIVAFIASNPKAGVVMQGTGGVRKSRFAGRGKGKSGGYRLITFYGAEDVPVFLLDVYGKDEKDDLSAAEKERLRRSSRRS